MLDPENFVLKAGVVAVTALAVVRVVWHDLSSLIDDVWRRRRRR